MESLGLYLLESCQFVYEPGHAIAVMPDFIARLGCRLVWGRYPLKKPPFHFRPHRRDRAYAWWGWWVVQCLPSVHSKVCALSWLKNMASEDKYTLGDFLIASMMDVADYHKLSPTLYNPDQHSEFLRHLTYTCNWAHLLTVTTEGRENPFPLLKKILEEMYLEALRGLESAKKKSLYVARPNESDRETLRDTFLAIWNLLYIYQDRVQMIL